MAKKITQRDISNKIRELFETDISEPRLQRLLEYLANEPKPMPMMNRGMPPAQTEGAPESPTMPNIVGKQQLMESNAIAQKYPFLGTR